MRVIRGVRFRTVYLSRGTGLYACFLRSLAARTLAREGVRQAVFLVDDAQRELFARHGVMGISPVPLYRATAAAIARRCLTQRGVAPRAATIAFAAEHVTPELRRAVTILAPEVRYVTLAVFRGGEALARTLRCELGVAARVAVPGEALCADLTLCFDPCGTEGLALYDPALAVDYDDGLPAELLAALWQAGALDAEKLNVREVEILNKA